MLEFMILQKRYEKQLGYGICACNFLVVFMMNEENWLCRMRTSRLSFHYVF